MTRNLLLKTYLSLAIVFTGLFSVSCASRYESAKSSLQRPSALPNGFCQVLCIASWGAQASTSMTENGRQPRVMKAALESRFFYSENSSKVCRLCPFIIAGLYLLNITMSCGRDVIKRCIESLNLYLPSSVNTCRCCIYLTRNELCILMASAFHLQYRLSYWSALIAGMNNALVNCMSSRLQFQMFRRCMECIHRQKKAFSENLLKNRYFEPYCTKTITSASVPMPGVTSVTYANIARLRNKPGDIISSFFITNRSADNSEMFNM